MDYIHNGRAYGAVAQSILDCDFNTGLRRPFIDENGQKMVTINTGKYEYNKELDRHDAIYEDIPVANLRARGYDSPVLNAASLRKDEWIQIDRTVIKAARARLRAWADLRRSNTVGGFNAYGKSILEREAMSDPGEAIVDMDAMSEGRTDSPKFLLDGTPLPITHSDFWFSDRRLAMSRNSGTPLNIVMAEAAGRRVAEMVEKTTIGVETGLQYGDSTRYRRTSKVYGYTNFPSRITYTGLTTPTGTNPEATINDILYLRELLYDAKYYGPYMIYHSTDWDRYLDNDYARLGGNNASMTLRDRIRRMDDIMDVRRLDFLNSDEDPFTLIMVQMTGDVARAIDGMPITTVQWESIGGLRLNFKVMCIQVPEFGADYYGNTGILHATTA